jgi:hypothetical protein
LDEANLINDILNKQGKSLENSLKNSLRKDFPGYFFRYKREYYLIKNSEGF